MCVDVSAEVSLSVIRASTENDTRTNIGECINRCIPSIKCLSKTIIIPNNSQSIITRIPHPHHTFLTPHSERSPISAEPERIDRLGGPGLRGYCSALLGGCGSPAGLDVKGAYRAVVEPHHKVLSTRGHSDPSRWGSEEDQADTLPCDDVPDPCVAVVGGRDKVSAVRVEAEARHICLVANKHPHGLGVPGAPHERCLVVPCCCKVLSCSAPCDVPERLSQSMPFEAPDAFHASRNVPKPGGPVAPTRGHPPTCLLLLLLLLECHAVHWA